MRTVDLRPAAQEHRGFTAPDVIFTVAILAAMAIFVLLSWQQIRFRIENTTVRDDLARAAMDIEVFKARHGRYPTSTAELDSLAYSPITRLTASKAYYAHESNNLAYCYNASGSRYGFAALSRAGVSFFVTDRTAGVADLDLWPASLSDLCSTITGFNTYGAWGYAHLTHTWSSWVSI